MVRHAKELEGNLKQRINCYASNAGTDCDSFSNKGRWVDHHMSQAGQQARSSRRGNVRSGNARKERTGRRSDTIEVCIDRYQ